MLLTISDWLQSTWLSHAFISQGRWAWPMCESLHFMGLCLLVGSVGLVDLRMLGMAKGIPVAALHKLVPFGVGGYLVNVITGSLFVVGDADQYIFNDAFRSQDAVHAGGRSSMCCFFIPVRFRKPNCLGLMIQCRSTSK